MNSFNDTIESLFPKQISYLNEYYDTSKEIKHNREFLNKFLEDNKDKWQDFKNDLTQHNINIIDFSALPNTNSCIKFQISLGKLNGITYHSTYYLSPFIPAYCFLTVSFDRTIKNVMWNEVCKELSDKQLIVNELFNKYFSNYELLKLDVLKTIMPDYSVDPFLPGEAKLFNLLFTFDPIMDKYLLL